jgi:putative endonuclease
MKLGYVYVMSNKRRTTFYIGVTSNLWQRVGEHKSGMGSVFTKKYRCFDLVYFEEHQSMYRAIVREKQLKAWHRPWKIRLIKSLNPDMKDLSEDLI